MSSNAFRLSGTLEIERLQLRHENTWLSTSVWQKYWASMALNGSRCLTVNI